MEELATASGTVGGMIGGPGERSRRRGQVSHRAPARIDSSRQDRSAAARQRSHGRDLSRARREDQLAALTSFGEHVGLAFQIVDDVLDVEQSSEALGKTAGKDAQQHKITFPAVYGLERSREMAEEERRGGAPGAGRFDERAERLQATRRSDRAAQRMTAAAKTRVVRSGRSRSGLDQLLVDRGLADSREKARALILAGQVMVDGQKSDKPGHSVRRAMPRRSRASACPM